MSHDETKDAIRNLLLGRGAHLPPEEALADTAPEKRTTRPAPGIHSVWEELEHLRLAQQDILRYTFDPDWESPPWPEGYWPDPDAPPAPGGFNESVRSFLADRDELVARLEDPELDPAAEFPGGEGRTYLRQFLLAADHNAYHLGQLVLVRKLVGDWGGG